MSNLVDQNVIRLYESDEESKVLVSSCNGDRFMKSSADAVRMLGFSEGVGQFFKQKEQQFQLLLERLHDWLQPRKAKIMRADVSFRDAGHLLFLVMQREAGIDEKLDDTLTDLDIEIAQNPEFDAWKVDMLLIPSVSDAAAQAFLASSKINGGFYAE